MENYDQEIERRYHPENFEEGYHTEVSRIQKIKPLVLVYSEKLDTYEINRMKHPDSRIEELADKLNEVIKYINEQD